MASPFSIFRRHQKMLLVVFGVLIMLVFTVGGVMMDAMMRYGGGAPADEVVVSYRSGQIRDSDFQQMHAVHMATIRFLYQVVEETRQRDGMPVAPGFGRNQAGEFDPGIPIAYTEDMLVETLVLSMKARELGMVVSDEAIYDFLENQLAVGLLSRSQLSAIFQRATGGQISQQHLFDQLRTELLAQNMRMLGRSGLFAEQMPIVPPTSAWNYFNRLHREATVEMLPLEVADFVHQVERAPTDAEIQELYDRYKNEYRVPGSPDPGFKRRERAAFEYVKARLEDFIEREVENVSEQDIREEYERRVEQGHYRVPREPQAPLDDDSVPVEETTPDDTAPVDDPAEDAAPADAAPAEDALPGELETPGQDEAADEDAPARDETADPETTDDPADAPEPQAVEQDAPPATDEEETAEQPAAEQPADAEAAGGESEQDAAQSQVERRATLFVALTDQDEDQARNGESADEGASQDAGEGEAAGPEARDAEAADEPAEEAAAFEQTPQETAEPEQPRQDPVDQDPEPPVTEEPVTEDAVTEDAVTEDAVTEEEPAEQEVVEVPAYRVRPLEEVRDDIARDLATQPARETMTETLRYVERQMHQYYRQYLRWTLVDEAEKREPPDLEALAEEHGLMAGSTPLVDPIEVEDYELGRAFGGSPFQQRSFAEIGFSDELPLYRPQQIRSFINDEEFVFWKVAYQEATVPPLSEIRDEVADVWSEREARTLAMNYARQLAEQVRDDSPLREVFPDHAARILQPPPFTWMTTGAVPQMGGMPQLSEVPGVEYAGTEFMEAVFSLTPGAVDLATDRPRKTVYLVRMVDESPPLELRRELFLRDPAAATMFIAFQERNRMFGSWYEDLEEEFDVEWHRPPEPLLRR